MSCHCALRERRNFLLTIYYSFCCSKSLVAIISSIWLHFLMKTPNTETPNTGAPKGQHSEGWKHRKVMTPVIQAWDGTLYHTAVVSCHTDISYRTDTSYNTDILSWYHILSLQPYTILASYPIMLISCHVAILCCIISYDTDISIADTISYIYIEATAIICVTKIDTI